MSIINLINTEACKLGEEKELKTMHTYYIRMTKDTTKETEQNIDQSTASFTSVIFNM